MSSANFENFVSVFVFRHCSEVNHRMVMNKSLLQQRRHRLKSRPKRKRQATKLVRKMAQQRRKVKSRKSPAIQRKKIFQW